MMISKAVPPIHTGRLVQVSKDLEQVIQIELNFSMILIKLRKIFSSIIPRKIDDKKLKKKVDNKGSIR